MKLLITGGTTFVSKYTAEYFVKSGDEVTVLNRGSRHQADGVKLIRSDRNLLKDELRGCFFDAVLDITAYTREHISSLLSSGVSFGEYVFISSSAVYPETNPQPFSEEQACGRNSVWGDYGLNKLEAERYLSQRVENAYILRPPYFYGIYENLYREAFVFDCAMLDRPFYLPSNPEMRLQFFNVADLCRFIEILLEKRPENRIFNVGNSSAVTVKEWVDMCYGIAGKKAVFKTVDSSVTQRDYFCFHNYEYVLDVSRQSELMPRTLPLEQGLKEEYEWYKKQSRQHILPQAVYGIH